MSTTGTLWLSGTATRHFAVDIGTPLEGYAARLGPATGHHDELQIGALVLCDGRKRFILVTADIAAVDTELVDDIAAMAGIDREELVVCASHTHSGPAGVVANLHPADADRTAPALRASFIATCVAAIESALDQLEPVELLFGVSDTTALASNRNDINGQYDPRVSALATRTQSGEFCSVLVHFACHPTILGANSQAISADFPGALRRSLGRSLHADGPAPEILFVNGAAGDVSTRYTRHGQDVAEVERVGAALAASAQVALDTAVTIHGSIRYERRQVNLSPRVLDDPVETIPGSEPILDSRLLAADRRREETRSQGEALLRRLVAVGPGQIPASIDIEVWALGDLVIFAVPGELFASLGARITESSPSPTLVLGYANGYAGYLADRDAYARGTYEAWASPFEAGAGERVAETGLYVARRVRGTCDKPGFGEAFMALQENRPPEWCAKRPLTSASQSSRHRP